LPADLQTVLDQLRAEHGTSLSPAPPDQPWWLSGA
jgi:hypothetical protein